MADSLRAEIICRDFNKMLDELASIDPKIEFRDVCIGVAARVAYSAMNKTKAATVSGIKKDYDKKVYTSYNGKKYNLTNRYPDALWDTLVQRRKDRLAIKLAMRGLSKQSFNWLAKALGESRSAPDYVTAANYKGKVYPGDADTTEQGSGSDFALTIINSSPIVQAAGGKNALLNAMLGETRYFQMNMENHAFSSFERRAAKYPQIFISKG